MTPPHAAKNEHQERATPAREREPVVRVSAAFSWHTAAIVVGGLFAAVTGGGSWVSHGSVSARLDQVLEKQREDHEVLGQVLKGERTLEIKLAKLEAQGTPEKLRELEERERATEAGLAELRGRERDRAR